MGRVKCGQCGEYFEQNIWGQLGELIGTPHVCSRRCASSGKDDGSDGGDYGDASE